MSESLFYFLLTLYFMKIIFHFMYLSKADRLMGRYEKMSFVGVIIKYAVILLPVFVIDPAHSHFKKEFSILKWVNIILFLLILVLLIMFLGLFIW